MRKPLRTRGQLNMNFVPNVFTVINMFLGFVAILLLQNGNPWGASWVILFAAGFDAIDGKTARRLGLDSKFGGEFDSMADTVSFCIFPSLVLYTLYVHGLPPLLGAMISFTPMLFGTIRLARFNLSHGKPTSFYTGLTTPLNTIIIVSFVMFNYQINGSYGDPRLALIIALGLGFLMISRVRFAKFPAFSFRMGRDNNLRLAGVVILAVSILVWQGLVLFPLLVIYISWSILNWMIDHNRFDESVDMNPSHDKIE